MSQIKQDPDKLKDYADSLSTHSAHWKNSIGALSTYMSRLGHSWRDDQFNEFEHEVRLLKDALGRYSEAIDAAVVDLRADADALERFLKIQVGS